MHWKSLELSTLPFLAETWELVDGFAEAPAHFHGSLLLAMNRQRAVLAELPDGRVMLWVRLTGSVAVVTQHGSTYCLPGQQVHKDRAWFLALMPVGAGKPRIPLPFPQGRLALIDQGKCYAVSIGDGAVMTPVPRMLSWDWAWAPTIGPVSLHLYVERSAEELFAWLRARLLHCYRFDADRVLDSTLDNNSWLVVADGSLSLGHRFHHVSNGQDGCDAFILWAAALGELGKLSFDLMDYDYVFFDALGYSCESLRDYLTPGPAHSRQQKHRWSVAPEFTIMVSSGADIETTISQELSRYTGLPLETPLAEIFQRLPLSGLPRRIGIDLPPGTPIPSAETLTLPLINRIRWTWIQRPG